MYNRKKLTSVKKIVKDFSQLNVSDNRRKIVSIILPFFSSR